MKPYAKHKSTGLKWLPEVPAHWKMLALGRMCSLVSTTGHEQEPLLSVYLNLGVVPFDCIKEKRTNVTSENLNNYQLVDPGDFVMNNQQAWRGSVGVSQYRGIVSPAYLVLRVAESIESHYANYLFRDRYMVANYVVASKGIGSIQRNLDWNVAKTIKVPVPPPDEQAKIVAYLDTKTAKIDRLIKLKEREIELLQEKKQAGIDKVVSLACGKCLPLEFVATPVSQCGGDNLPLLSVYLNKGVVRYDDVDERRTNVTSEDLSKYQIVEPGDLVLNNQQAWRGSVGVSKYDGIISPAYVILRLSDEWDSAYANYYFRSRRMVDKYVLASRGVGSIQRNLIWPILKQFKICLPPRELQRELVSVIEEQASQVETAVCLITRQIALLKEYRTRLISDAVTGRIDLREVS